MADPLDAASAYTLFLPKALELSAEAIVPYRLDPDLAIANIKTAMPALLAKKADIPAHLPKVDLVSLLSLPDLALAVKFGALKAEQAAPSEKTITERLAEARDHRRLLLTVAKGLAAADLVPRTEIDAIVAGRGNRDVAEDCVSLAELFRKHTTKIAGNHPITTLQIDACASVGTWLLANMRPTNAPAEKAGPPTEAVEKRNRLGTLLVRRYEELRKVVHYFHGEGYEELAPPLMSRRARKANVEEKPELGPA